MYSKLDQQEIDLELRKLFRIKGKGTLDIKFSLGGAGASASYSLRKEEKRFFQSLASVDALYVQHETVASGSVLRSHKKQSKRQVGDPEEIKNEMLSNSEPEDALE